jgi:Sulfotransferase domain
MTGSTERAAGRRDAARRAPDFFIVGHHKSGTTALYQMLRAHPQIYMPALKEPRFFAPDLRALLGSNGALPTSFEDYLALFDDAAPGQRTGEASPSYLRSELAAQLIARARPDARIIAILREPASFVRSLHLHLLREGVETETDLATAFAHEQITREGRRVLRYSDHVRYTEQLRRYHAVFPREQVLVLIYEEFREDNESAVRGVFRFLGVAEDAPLTPVEANPAVRVRSRRLQRTLGRASSGRGPGRLAATALRRALPAQGAGRARLRSLAGRLVYAQPPPGDAKVMSELRRRFAGEVAALGEYLGRDLVGLWGYDAVE